LIWAGGAFAQGKRGVLVSVQEVLLSEGSKSDSSYFC
jgi:hypothetical protein